MDLRRQRETVFFLAYSFLAIGLLVIGMEEISWGQRIFNMDTPSVLETHNVKGELNFHNVDGLHCTTPTSWSGSTAPLPDF